MQLSGADNFIRGGQTVQHWLRMAAQVIKGMIAFGAATFVAMYILLCVLYYEVPKMHLTWGYAIAEFSVENRGSPKSMVRYKDPAQG